MKTTKFFLIVALVSIATLTFSQSNNDRVNNQLSVKITLKCALQDPYLAMAMHEQLNRDFLNGSQETRYYHAAVKYKGIRYVIYGTYEEWIDFFKVAIENSTPET